MTTKTPDIHTRVGNFMNGRMTTDKNRRYLDQLIKSIVVSSTTSNSERQKDINTVKTARIQSLDLDDQIAWLFEQGIKEDRILNEMYLPVIEEHARMVLNEIKFDDQAKMALGIIIEQAVHDVQVRLALKHKDADLEDIRDLTCMKSKELNEQDPEIQIEWLLLHSVHTEHSIINRISDLRNKFEIARNILDEIPFTYDARDSIYQLVKNNVQELYFNVSSEYHSYDKTPEERNDRVVSEAIRISEFDPEAQIIWLLENEITRDTILDAMKKYDNTPDAGM